MGKGKHMQGASGKGQSSGFDVTENHAPKENKTDQSVKPMRRKEDTHQKALERLQRLRPMDDEFMRCLYRNNIPLAELTLRIILQKEDLIIKKCVTQKDMKCLAGARSLCLDLDATDSEEKVIDLEVQREDRGADPHRVRYHSSSLDIENLRAGQDFKELPETYTIFITENDIYGMGEPFYSVERMNLTTGKPFDDGEHILFVNGAYRGDSPIGKLMHDFNCSDADDMYYDLLAERTRYLKQTQEGVKEMSKIIEDLINEVAEEVAKEKTIDIASAMLSAGKYALEEIASLCGLSLDEVADLSNQKKAGC